MDGMTILPEIPTLDPGESNRVWSYEEPTREDYKNLNAAVRLTTSERLRLERQLGHVISLPHTQNNICK
jgi:hypothetical protein